MFGYWVAKSLISLMLRVFGRVTSSKTLTLSTNTLYLLVFIERLVKCYVCNVFWRFSPYTRPTQKTCVFTYYMAFITN